MLLWAGKNHVQYGVMKTRSDAAPGVGIGAGVGGRALATGDMAGVERQAHLLSPASPLT